MAVDKYYDVLVVGTGFSGLSALYYIKQLDLNLSLKGIEAGSDVGGTWYWNRYPGARTDCNSHVYRFAWDKDLLQTSKWSHNYLSQPELEEHFRETARKNDLYPLISFDTTLTAATWDDARGLWKIETSRGEKFDVRYLVTGIGILHKASVPNIPGLETFNGRIVHSSAWSPDISWENKRIGVIGTGATGVQLVGALGAKAKTLTHFIRHAQYVLPAAYREVPPQERQLINSRYDEIWSDVFTSYAGMGFPEPSRTAFTVSAEDRETIFQNLWQQGSGFRFLLGGFSDLATNEAANREAINFIHKKISQIVQDPRKAAVLTSNDLFARRPLTDDDYYHRFNQSNVDVVDIKAAPILAATSEGLHTADGKLFPLDLIVFATGFDAVDGSYYAIDFRGRGGIALSQHWAAGTKTTLGAMTAEFPNLFFVQGPGVVWANNAPAADEAARLVASLIERSEGLRREGQSTGVVESSPESDQKWFEEVCRVGRATLFAKTPSWFFGENVPGRVVAPRFYFGGLHGFRRWVAEMKGSGWAGFGFG